MNNKEKIKEYRRKYYIEHRKIIQLQNEQTRKRNPEKARERVRRFAKTLKGRYAIYKNGAKVRGLVFDITLDEFTKLVKQSCYYCGGNGYGIDRLDSSIGYTKNNIVPCCSMCNMMKQSYTKENFVNQCEKITDRHCKNIDGLKNIK